MFAVATCSVRARGGLEVVAVNKIDLPGLITHRFTLDRVDAAFCHTAGEATPLRQGDDHCRMTTPATDRRRATTPVLQHTLPRQRRDVMVTSLEAVMVTSVEAVNLERRSPELRAVRRRSHRCRGVRSADVDRVDHRRRLVRGPAEPGVGQRPIMDLVDPQRDLDSTAVGVGLDEHLGQRRIQRLSLQAPRHHLEGHRVLPRLVGTCSADGALNGMIRTWNGASQG